MLFIMEWFLVNDDEEGDKIECISNRKHLIFVFPGKVSEERKVHLHTQNYYYYWT